MRHIRKDAIRICDGCKEPVRWSTGVRLRIARPKVLIWLCRWCWEVFDYEPYIRYNSWLHAPDARNVLDRDVYHRPWYGRGKTDCEYNKTTMYSISPNTLTGEELRIIRQVQATLAHRKQNIHRAFGEVDPRITPLYDEPYRFVPPTKQVRKRIRTSPVIPGNEKNPSD